MTCYKSFKTAPVCPHCGAKYTTTERELTEMKSVEIRRITSLEMEELERQKKSKRMEVGQAKTKSELIKIARERVMISLGCNTV